MIAFARSVGSGPICTFKATKTQTLDIRAVACKKCDVLLQHKYGSQ